MKHDKSRREHLPTSAPRSVCPRAHWLQKSCKVNSANSQYPACCTIRWSSSRTGYATRRQKRTMAGANSMQNCSMKTSAECMQGTSKRNRCKYQIPKAHARWNTGWRISRRTAENTRTNRNNEICSKFCSRKFELSTAYSYALNCSTTPRSLTLLLDTKCISTKYLYKQLIMHNWNCNKCNKQSKRQNMHMHKDTNNKHAKQINSIHWRYRHFLNTARHVTLKILT